MGEQPKPGRKVWVLVAGVATVMVAVLAFGVFGVQTLFIDDTVDEAGPTFDSGAATTAEATTTVPDLADDAQGAAATTVPSTTEPPAPPITEAGRGTFAPGDHPGSGTAIVLTDGSQTFVRFEDDFATDNGPDLYATIQVGGQRVELGRLKGNQGSQNYEVPASVDPAAIEAVSVWCKRFDSTFTTATLS